MIVEISDLADALARGTRLLGLDPGKKRVGMAVSDPGLMVASPIGTIKRTRFTADLEALRKVIAEHAVGGLVIGLPVNMDGTEGPRCQSVRQFAGNLDEAGLGLPIAFWDERLSSAAVERFLVEEADMTRKRRGEVVDKMAAAYILQGALDAIGAQSGGAP